MFNIPQFIFSQISCQEMEPKKTPNHPKEQEATETEVPWTLLLSSSLWRWWISRSWILNPSSKALVLCVFRLYELPPTRPQFQPPPSTGSRNWRGRDWVWGWKGSDLENHTEPKITLGTTSKPDWVQGQTGSNLEMRSRLKVLGPESIPRLSRLPSRLTISVETFLFP